MRAGIIGLIAIAILVGGTLMGIASLLLVPLVAAVALIALAAWLLVRRVRGKPPIR
jgi:predicted PurR-regulated permease PerM